MICKCNQQLFDHNKTRKVENDEEGHTISDHLFVILRTIFLDLSYHAFWFIYLFFSDETNMIQES